VASAFGFLLSLPTFSFCKLYGYKKLNVGTECVLESGRSESLLLRYNQPRIKLTLPALGPFGIQAA
jgi:hypothetical protein